MTLLERIQAIPSPYFAQASEAGQNFVWSDLLEFDPSDGLMRVDVWATPGDLRELADFQERLQAAVKAHKEEQCKPY